MKDTLELIFFALLLSSFWCYGFKTVIEKLLFKTLLQVDFDDQWERLSNTEKIIFRPLFGCPPCMGSIHGTAIFFLFLYGTLDIVLWIPFCFMLCGLNFIISQLGYE